MTKKLTKASFNKIKKHYLSEKIRLEKSLQNSDDEIDSDGDEIDLIQAKSILELKNRLNTRDLGLLNRITSVLNRIDSENINICQECEEAIGEKRLMANPGCIICFDCAAESEILSKSFSK